MKAQVKFLARASVQREVEVDVKEDATEAEIHKAAIEKFELDEDLCNLKGGWEVNRVEVDNVILDTSQPLTFRSNSDEHGALGDAGSIIPSDL